MARKPTRFQLGLSLPASAVPGSALPASLARGVRVPRLRHHHLLPARTRGVPVPSSKLAHCRRYDLRAMISRFLTVLVEGAEETASGRVGPMT